MASRATIQLRGRHGVIDIDGQDISHVARSITVSQDSFGDGGPLVTVELIITDLLKVDAENPRVQVGPDTRAALVALGWTPPDPDEAETESETQEDTLPKAKEARRGRSTR